MTPMENRDPGPSGGWVRLYRLLLRTLPAHLRRDDQDTVGVLEEQLRHTRSLGARLVILLRAFGRLPGVVLIEWVEATGSHDPSPQSELHGRRGDHMGVLIQNLKFANRTLRKSPTFTWATVLLIALGVGAVTTVFTIVDHVILRPLPYPAQDRLAYMTNGSHSGPTLRGLDQVEAFDLWTATTGADVNLALDGAERLLLRSSEVTP